MNLTEVFVGLGGNIGDSASILQEALKFIGELPGVFELKSSRFYVTTPVSDIPQSNYINAVCSFKTMFCARELLDSLQSIERKLGKKPKLKNAPRVIDLDILFFGEERHLAPDLEIPHPRWQERMFVLVPLFDLVPSISIPMEGGMVRMDIHSLLQSFKNLNNESVSLQVEELAI